MRESGESLHLTLRSFRAFKAVKRLKLQASPPPCQGNAVTVRGRLADPRHIELDEAVTDMTGRVEVVLRSVSGPAPALSAAARVLRARAFQADAPPQQSDSVDLLRTDRER